MKKPRLEKAERAIIGPSLLELKKLIIELAKREKHTLFVGETGTGKELLARLFLAALPESRKGHFDAFNCATYHDDNLLYSELFGHVKGAFTGANQNRDGLIPTCDKGALFLDELGHAQSRVQVSLLRYLQTKDYKPLGADKSKTTDVCIVATASNEKSLTPELKMRFQVAYVPGLSQRRGDKYQLIKHFLMREDIKQITQGALDLLLQMRFPGNIRQLEHLIERSVISSSLEGIELLRKEDIPATGGLGPILKTEPSYPERVIAVNEIDSGKNFDPIPIEQFSKPFIDPDKRSIDKLLDQARGDDELKSVRAIAEPLEEMVNFQRKGQIKLAEMKWEELKRRYLEELLLETGGNQKRAAELAGVKPSTFKNLLIKYKLRPKDQIRSK